jgi:hypothetical protein
MFGLEAEDYADTFVSVEECAKVMAVSPERVRQLMKLRILRTRYQWGSVLVQPAAVRGWTA